MNSCYIPEGYKNPLSVYETQRAIEFIKHNFLRNLCHALNLKRVSAPLFVEESSGLNDKCKSFTLTGRVDHLPDICGSETCYILKVGSDYICVYYYTLVLRMIREVLISAGLHGICRSRVLAHHIFSCYYFLCALYIF